MKKFNFVKSLSCLILLFLTGCDGEDSPPPCKINQELIPLKVGNQWTYLSYRFNEPDTIVMAITGEFSLVIKGDSITAFKIAQSVNNSPHPDGYEALYWSGPQGSYLLGGKTNIDTLLAQSLQTEFRCNKEVGDTWEVARPVYSLQYPYKLVFEKVTYKLISSNEAIETPAGTFNCYVYQYTRADLNPGEEPPYYFDYTYYIAPGIGIVGTNVRAHGDPIERGLKTLLYSTYLN